MEEVGRGGGFRAGLCSKPVMKTFIVCSAGHQCVAPAVPHLLSLNPKP